MEPKQPKAIEYCGSTGGPRVINRTFKTDKTHNVQIAFDSNSSASVTIRGTGATQLEVIDPARRVHSKGTWSFSDWHTALGGV